VGEATRLLLIESDTGSGKTEAALAWWMRLYAEGKVDGLYFALPTRVAARELYTRVLQAVERAFEPDQRPRPVLLAAPGYVRIDGEPVLPDPSGALWDDDTARKWRERLWSAERPKRFLAAPVAVGTIDQALLSVLQVKHSLMRSVCLDRHLLVVDEVHASDPYMRELLKGLLRGHLARGGWALLLSATLGETAAAAFFGREPVPLAAAMARPYPLISARNRIWPMPPARERTVAAELAPSWTRMRR
jgi:CRISPR-associated endonuclease/helicase Cas3